MKTIDETYKEKLDKLINNSLITNGCYYTLKRMLKLQAEDNDVMNLSVSFYRIIIHSCVTTKFVELCKEYDRKRKNLNLYNLLKSVKDIPGKIDLSSSYSINILHSLEDTRPEIKEFNSGYELIDYALSKFDNAEETFKKVKKLRNKYYAHYDLDKSLNLKEFFSENRVTYQEMGDLLLLYSNLLNCLNVILNDTITVPLVSSYNDFDITLACIKDGMNKKNRR